MKKVTVILSVLLVAGCSNTIGKSVCVNSNDVKVGDFSQDVRIKLGNPTAEYKKGNLNIWDYDYTRTSFNFWYTVPFIGMFTNPYHYTRETCQITFDTDKVTKIKQTQKSGSINSKNNII